MIEVLLSGQLLLAAAATGATYALVALGLNLVYGTMRLLNVAHGDLVMLGGYAAFWAFTLGGLSPFLSLVLVIVAAAALGLAAWVGLFRRLLRSARPVEQVEASSLLLFFGLSIIVQNAVALGFSATPRGYEVLSGVVHIGEAAITGNRLAAFAAALLALGAIGLFLKLHVFGLAMRALIEQRTAAEVVGVDLARVERASFAIGFASAALAGVLVSMTQQVSPFMGFPFTIAAFVVVILGGLGRIGGGIGAGFLFGAVEVYGVALASPSYRSILLYAVFVAVALGRPQGLFGRRAVVR